MTAEDGVKKQVEVRAYVDATLNESIQLLQNTVNQQAEVLFQACEMISGSVLNGGKLLICGNGGSAADSQHMAAEMVGRMLIERKPLPALALTTDTSNLTAIANDYDFDSVFVKQVQALGRKGDVLLAISTSGNSKNVVNACEEARSLGMKVIALTGGHGGKLKSLADVCLCAEGGKNSSRIQETHLFMIHSIVDLMDRFYFGFSK